MPNLYGVANAPGLPVLCSAGSDVVCTHDVYTAVITSSTPLIAPSQGYFYALLMATVEVSLGASLPTGLVAGAAIGAGSFGNLIAYSPSLLAANSSTFISYFSFTAPSQTAWQGTGSTVSLGLNPNGQNATVRAFSAMTAILFRAPDQ